MKKLLLISFTLLCVHTLLPRAWAASATNTFDPRAFGAKGDGKTLDTDAIQKALDACGKAGGGTVTLSAGTYLSRPITLRTRTTIRLEEGAVLKATDEPSHYLPATVTWEMILNQTEKGPFTPFIGGKDLEQVTITGKGTIDGSGAKWWVPAEEARRKVSGYTLPRPNLIVLNRCRNVRLAGITLRDAPKFHFVPTDCEDVVVEDVSIFAPEESANTDGIDPSNSRNVTITRCTIDVGDDNIAIKSGKKVEGREFGCENIVVTDCLFRHGHGMSIGSETVGGVRNVTVKNCRFENTENGIRIKSRRDRGGRVENILFSDLVMSNVYPAISIAGYYQNSSQLNVIKDDPAQPVTETTPAFRNIRVINLTATSTKAAGQLIGLPESVLQDVVLENVHIRAATGLTLANARGVQLRNVKIEASKGESFILHNVDGSGLPARNP
jgi:polygalacturonase